MLGCFGWDESGRWVGQTILEQQSLADVLVQPPVELSGVCGTTTE